MTATITFELLGVENTIPSSSGPSSATFTSSPAAIDSIAGAYPALIAKGREGPFVRRPRFAAGNIGSELWKLVQTHLI